ncbi:protein MOR1-like isoform X2 [Triticum dicoccoides]|uniref:protein MOR1-like isoform X2 n=1 Tax=Triticum dicoccoides TaxID=85692 RepID=UPI001890DF08|nr:protein MOR1-like isoform X2 [Triticum dicoccoides]
MQGARPSVVLSHRPVWRGNRRPPTKTSVLAVDPRMRGDCARSMLQFFCWVLQSTIYEVDLDCILQSVHIYLQELGMEEIRRRAGADNKPLRMVKIVLHELVKLRGTAIKGHLSMVPIDSEHTLILISRPLQQLGC